MNHQIPPFNQNLPILGDTDWASMAKQWATLRANVNIPPAVNKVENYAYHNIPPPPPPPPGLPIQKPNILSYNNNNDYHSIINHDQMISFNRNMPHTHSSNNNNIYEPPIRSFYEEMVPTNTTSVSQCETFDYNHRDRAFVNFNNINAPYRPPPSTATFSPQNMFNLPPPTHQDYIIDSQPLKSASFMPLDTHPPAPAPPPKLFPIMNSDEYSHNPSMLSNCVMKQPLQPYFNKYDNQTNNDFASTGNHASGNNSGTARSNKGLPAWIIDDMKKIKEKERKQPYTAAMDDFRDHPVNSKRDEEGDIVMEDVIKECDLMVDCPLSGKSVIATNRIDTTATTTTTTSTTEIDIDDVNLNDEDDGFDKIDYSSKSLVDLIDMLDENELDNLKIIIIRDSLTGVMKQVTDDMISEVVNSTFTKELSKINAKPKVKGISDATVKSVDGPAILDVQADSTCHLLGLDVYESDDETTVDNNLETDKDTSDRSSATNESRKRWSSHKKSSSDVKVDSKKSSLSQQHSRDSQKLSSKEKRKSSNDSVAVAVAANSTGRNQSPKRSRNRSKSRDHSRKRSKSRDRHRSPQTMDYRRRSRSKDRNGGGGGGGGAGAGGGESSSHKKSKKHSNRSPESKEYRWKNDKCDNNNNNSNNSNRSSSGKKQSKRDRSRS